MELKIKNATKYRQKLKMRQNADKKPLRFCWCVVVSVWVYMGVGVCVYVWMRVFKLSQAKNVKWFTDDQHSHNIYIYIYIYIYNAS